MTLILATLPPLPLTLITWVPGHPLVTKLPTVVETLEGRQLLGELLPRVLVILPIRTLLLEQQRLTLRPFPLILTTQIIVTLPCLSPLILLIPYIPQQASSLQESSIGVGRLVQWRLALATRYILLPAN